MTAAGVSNIWSDSYGKAAAAFEWQQGGLPGRGLALISNPEFKFLAWSFLPGFLSLRLLVGPGLPFF